MTGKEITFEESGEDLIDLMESVYGLNLKEMDLNLGNKFLSNNND